MTFDRRIDEFLTHLKVERGLRPNSLSAYATDLRIFSEYLADQRVRRLTAIDKAILQGFLRAQGKDGLKSSTQARRWAAIRGLFRYLREEGVIKADPTQGVPSPQVERRLPDLLSRAEVEALIEAAGTDSPLGLRDTALLELMYASGCRVSEAATLRLDIANTDGPAGEYSLEVLTDGRVTATYADAITFASGERKSITVPLTAEMTGRSAIRVQLAHADGTTVEHALSIPVRPSALPVTTRRIVSLAANGGSIRVDEELLGDSLLDGASVSIGVSPVAAFDIPSLLVSLDRYPYGCAEQTTSRALPLLYVAELSAQAGLDPDPEVGKRVQDAILRVLSYQSSSGSFGLWAPGYGDLWLDSYVTEFLTRARELDYQVPEEGMRLALDNLRNSISYDLDIEEDQIGARLEREVRAYAKTH